MVLWHKFNYLIINKMKQEMNYEGMSYSELVAQKMALEMAINKMREQEMKRAFDELLKTYSVSKEEMMRIYFGEDYTSSIPVVENTLETGKAPLALPEPQVETPKEETISITPEPQEENKLEGLWNHPALKAPYTSKAGKKNEAAPEESPETELPTMESLLSDVPEYRELYTPKVLMKKSKKSLPTMDELLADDPTNRILCLGNQKEKGSPYRQHTRINHADGIIPTETATGKTMVYIPPRPTMKA